MLFTKRQFYYLTALPTAALNIAHSYIAILWPTVLAAYHYTLRTGADLVDYFENIVQVPFMFKFDS